MIGNPAMKELIPEMYLKSGETFMINLSRKCFKDVSQRLFSQKVPSFTP